LKRPAKNWTIYTDIYNTWKMPITNIPKLLNPNEHVTEAQQKARLDICATCPRKGRRFGKDVCKVCKCFLDMKTRLKSERCPLAKWERIL